MFRITKTFANYKGTRFSFKILLTLFKKSVIFSILKLLSFTDDFIPYVIQNVLLFNKVRIDIHHARYYETYTKPGKLLQFTSSILRMLYI